MDAFMLGLIQKNNKELKNPDDLFYFSNFSENHELFSNENEMWLENLK